MGAGMTILLAIIGVLALILGGVVILAAVLVWRWALGL